MGWGAKGKPNLRANLEPLLRCTTAVEGIWDNALAQLWAGQIWPLCGSTGHAPDVPTAGTRQGLQQPGVTGLLHFGASSQSYWNLNPKWVIGISVQSFICFQSRFSEHKLEFRQEFLKLLLKEIMVISKASDLNHLCWNKEVVCWSALN